MAWPDKQPHFFTSTPTEVNVDDFARAMRSLLEGGDMSIIMTLAQRLRPFRIDLVQQDLLGAVAVTPILILEDHQLTGWVSWRARRLQVAKY